MAKVCCIIPVFNAGKYVARTIESVLAQTRLPDEIIAVNDSSTDNSLEVLQGFGDQIRIITIQHSGVSAAVNAGVQNTSADLISYIDSDDLWAPTKIELQLMHFEKQPATQAVFGHVKQFTSEELIDDNIHHKQDGEVLPGFSKLTMMIRRNAFLHCGNFDEQVERGDFIEWFSRFKRTGSEFEMLPEILAYRRLRANSLSANETAEKNLARVMKMHLDRKRMK